MIWDKKEVNRYMDVVLPPEVKTFPDGIRPDRGGGGGPELFSRAVGVAVLLANEGNDLLLDALRKKWPEAVEASLPKEMHPSATVLKSNPDTARLAYA
jgi:hypothetical protein